MKTRIIILRHGETVENISHIVQGQNPGKLTKQGIDQARRAGLRLRKEKIDIIYSSDLKRARDTTKQIAKHHDVRVVYDKRLRERNFGMYEGKSRNIFMNALKKSSKHIDIFKPRGGENRVDMERRSRDFFNGLLDKYPGKNILIISHGGFIINSLSCLMNDSYENNKKYMHGNTGISVFDLYRDKNNDLRIKINKLNCTKHLK